MKNLDLGGRLLRSTSAATLSQVWRVGVTFATQMILRRLVPVDDWGHWHWALDYLFVLLGQVRDLGIPAHMVRDRERPWGNYLAVQVVWGVALAIAIFVASPWIARAGPEGEHMVPLLRGLVIFFVVEGIGKVPLTFFEAELRIERALMPELVRNVTFAAVAITLAVLDFGIYCMLIAHVTAAVVFAVLVWWQAWGQMPLTWIAGGTWPMVLRSSPLMPMAMVILAMDVADYQLVGLLAPSSVVGLYGGALTLSLLVPRVLEWPLRRALYPAFVAVRDDAARFFETYRLSTVLLMTVHVPVAGFLFANAELLLTRIWGESYGAAAPYLQALCLVPLVQPFARCAEDVLLPRHQEKLLTMAIATNLAAFVGFGIFFMAQWGETSLPLAKLLPVGSVPITWAILRIDPRRFGRLTLDLAAVYAVPALFYGVAWLVTAEGGPLRLGLTALAGVLSVLVYYRLFGRAFVDFFRALPSR